MTKRLAISMLLTVWAILIAAGVTAYVTTRAVLVANLDDSLVARAGTLQGVDRYVVTNDIGQTLESSTKETPDATIKPMLLSAKFANLGDGQRVRTVLVSTYRRDADGVLEPVKVAISESTASLDRLLNRLQLALVISGCVGGILAALIARGVARMALSPLHETAKVFGEIDERNLSRRIDPARLAPELHPVAEKLNDMLARLETSFANRKQFIADASHELRTPVAALVTTLEVSLRRLRDADTYRQTMQTCLTDARLLRKLVEALMDQARSEIAAFNEEPEPTNVAALLHNCAAMLQAAASEKGLTLSQTIDEPMQLTVQPGRLKQAVMGLLENAIDHNRSGGTMELYGGIEKGRLRIVVKDTGPGIAPEHLSRVFEPFYRVSRSRDVSGHLGLGLHLVRSHVESMGGKCLVRSEVGIGSAFEIVLPVEAAMKTIGQPAAVN
jgi:signal transduction histidine kinase